MESGKIRDLYLDFFVNKTHNAVPGSSLIPFDDPTLLFTNSGMVQFKKFWATDAALPYSKAVTCQKCLRAGGKDSDFDKIGFSDRHHTFFEMLGNFSFGDYFKKEAIEWAYEFISEFLKLQMENVWVSYYFQDNETKELWKKFFPEERIVALGDRDNFWGPAGDTGPCGPCTELYMDLGPEKACGDSCLPGCDCSRFLEFWNLVFPQYDKKKDGSLPPLNRRGVDTGMGLERISRIMQGVESNYETDLFLPIIRKLENLSEKSYVAEPENVRPFFKRVSDHVRAAVFLVDDNILPSNEGRGYVLRRIVRRAAVSGSYLGIKEPFLYKLCEEPEKIMGGFYPSLRESGKIISGVLFEEEERFLEILETAAGSFRDFMGEVKEGVMPGETVFRIYDTYGVPADVLEEIAFQENISLDWEGFSAALEKQKKQSRFSSAEDFKKNSIYENLPLLPTVFTGYSNISEEAQLKLVYEDHEKSLVYLVFDRTPFYPERGGQAGDKGVIENGCMRFRVEDTRIDEKGFIYHIAKLEKGNLSGMKGDDYHFTLLVDAGYRKRVSLNHTATHLLHFALKKVYGRAVRQAGSFVAADRFRFDFVCLDEVSERGLTQVEEIVQESIFKGTEIQIAEKTLEEAQSSGAIALFTEKYEDKVRVMSIGDYHSEVCGGTHAGNTSDLALFLITGFSSVGKNLKRIEAATYSDALSSMHSYRSYVRQIGEMLGAPPDKTVQKVKSVISLNSEKDKLIEKYEESIASLLSTSFMENRDVVTVNGNVFNYIAGKLSVNNGEIAGKIADRLACELEKCIVFLAYENKDKILFVLKSSEDVKKLLPAVGFVKNISGIIGGNGGGNEAFARGSGRNPDKFKEASEAIKQVIQNKGKSK